MDPQLEAFINASVSSTQSPGEFFRCFRLGTCGACIQGEANGCAWCPYVSVYSFHFKVDSQSKSRDCSILSRQRKRHFFKSQQDVVYVTVRPLTFIPPQSGICVPLPRNGSILDSTLLAPIQHDDICPFPWQERWELRTKPFGCNCSTTTFLAALITCLSTLVALFVLWSSLKILGWCFKACRGVRGGWELRVVGDEERRVGRIWVRKRTWKEWWRTVRGQGNEDVVVVTESTRLLGEPT